LLVGIMDSCLVHLCAWSWSPKLRIRPPIEGFRLDPRFLVELGFDSIPGDLARLRSQVLGQHTLGTLHTFPKSFVKSSNRLGDPWMGRWFGSFDFRLGLLFPCLADRLWGEVRPGVLCKYLSSFLSIRLASSFWMRGVWRTVRPEGANRPRGTSCSRTVDV
jgi:hypothetical protein